MNYVIIVEDEEMLADALVGMLKDEGQEAVAFGKAQDALSYITQTSNRISIALVDIGLPDMSGLQFSKRLHKIAPDIPVIIFTGYLEDDLDTKDTHIIRTLQKPVGIDVILDLIKIHGMR